MNLEKRLQFIIFCLSAVFFLPFLGAVPLFDWDEINFAECAREMLMLDEYLKVYINYQPFWEKPPLFIWFQAISMSIFGINEYAARLPNAICGILTLQILFLMGKKLYHAKFGFWWAICYLGSILPHFYFKTGIIDPVFNLFIFLGIYFFLLFYWKKEQFEIELSKKPLFYLIISGIFIGLAILTKGPVAYLIFGLCLFVFWILQKFKLFISIPHFLLFSVICGLPMLLWIGVETLKNGTWFLEEFIKYQIRLFQTKDAGHGGFFGYHFVVLLFGCFPISFFALFRLFKNTEKTDFQRNFMLFMQILFWVILVLFSVVSTKIVHYSSMAYFPISFLGTLFVWQMIENKISVPNSLKISLLVFSIILGAVVFALPFVGQNLDSLKDLIKDDFAKANFSAQVDWHWSDGWAGIYLILLLISVLFLFHFQKINWAFQMLFVGMAVMMMGTLSVFPNIERYTQAAALDFFRTLQNKDVYVTTIGYKSYAHLFYAKIPVSSRPNTNDGYEWTKFLLHCFFNKKMFLCKNSKTKNSDADR
ncbi:MAG: glycosyltransferase family 39 protein [Bacteroidetes bacterium]|nr:MAG: glycosyltransferase family 39 protein [Bacteroidota bacterium]